MKILFAGGGTGGHFYPIIAVAKKLQEVAKLEHTLPPELYFMAPDPFDERTLFENNIKFVRAPAGKIRRYFSLLNYLDMFKTGIGVLKAIFSVFLIYPDVVFGKGGHGSFPALFAARLFRIPVIIHESDTSPGRVNAWAGKFAQKIAVSYPETAKYFREDRTVWTGLPIRDEITKPIKEGAAEYLKLESEVPVILILGGSQGATRINDAVLDALPDLLNKYQVIHQTGSGKYKEVLGTASVVLDGNPHQNRYKPFPFLNELALRMASGISSLVISRAGSTLFEIATWEIPSILVPLPEEISHDQMGNAYAYARSGSCVVIEDKNLTPKLLAFEIDRIMNNEAERQKMIASAKEFAKRDAAEKIAHAIFGIAIKHEA